MDRIPQIISGVGALLSVLCESEMPRDVYLGRDGDYYVTFGGGKVDAETVHQAVSSCKIAETFPGEGFEY